MPFNTSGSWLASHCRTFYIVQMGYPVFPFQPANRTTTKGSSFFFFLKNRPNTHACWYSRKTAVNLLVFIRFEILRKSRELLYVGAGKKVTNHCCCLRFIFFNCKAYIIVECGVRLSDRKTSTSSMLYFSSVIFPDCKRPQVRHSMTWTVATHNTEGDSFPACVAYSNPLQQYISLPAG